VLANRAFSNLERLLAERRSLMDRVSEIVRAGGPQPLQLEQEAFANLNLDAGNRLVDILLYLEAYLVAAGSISGLLFPSHRDVPTGSVERRSRRAELLRDQLAVTEDSPLRIRPTSDGDARGGLVHIDEMIDVYGSGQPEADVFPFEVGREAVRGERTPWTFLRFLDDSTIVLKVGDRTANLRQIRDEIRRIGARIQVSASLTLLMTDRPVPPGAASTGFGV
jgi:hypothetical protein